MPDESVAKSLREAQNRDSRNMGDRMKWNRIQQAFSERIAALEMKVAALEGEKPHEAVPEAPKKQKKAIQ